MTPLEIAKEIIGTSEDSRTWHQITIDCAELIKEYATEQIKKERERILKEVQVSGKWEKSLVDEFLNQPITLD